MFRSTAFVRKCSNFSHAEPLPSQEPNGELIWLSLLAFLIGELVSWVGMSSSGNRGRDRAGYSQMALQIDRLAVVLMERYSV